MTVSYEDFIKNSQFGIEEIVCYKGSVEFSLGGRIKGGLWTQSSDCVSLWWKNLDENHWHLRIEFDFDDKENYLVKNAFIRKVFLTEVSHYKNVFAREIENDLLKLLDRVPIFFDLVRIEKFIEMLNDKLQRKRGETSCTHLF